MKRLTSLLPIFLFLLIFTGNLPAQERTIQELQERARSHFSSQAPEKPGMFSLTDERTVQLAGSASSFLSGVEKESFYIFTEGDSKFVILSADQRMPEILGYSNEGTLEVENIPEGMRALLASYQLAADELENGFTFLQEEVGTKSEGLLQAKKPLLNGISWAQDYPYYNECPAIGTERTLVGCVATAMSTIMAYYQYPDQGKGSVSYTWNGKTLTRDLSTRFYQWDKIRDRYSYIQYLNSIQNLFEEEESQEVAKLCYDVALSIQTSFGTQASSSYNTVKLGLEAFVNHFSYDPHVQVLYRNYFSRAEWLSILQQEIAADRPVLYRGGETALSGHVFIADGYDSDGLIHFDFGWGGMANGYYHIAAISPDDLGAGTTGGYGFNIDQFIFVGLQPPTINSSYQSHLVLNKAMTFSSSSLSRTGFFSIQSTLLNKGTYFQGVYCAMLIGKDGSQYEISSPVSVTLTMDGASNFTLSGCQIPETVPNGLYELRIVAKGISEKDWNYTRALATVPEYCAVWVEDTSVQLANRSTGVTLHGAKIGVEHALYQHVTGDFTLTLSNGDNEFLGTIGIGALSGRFYTVLADCIGSVQSGETISYSLTGTVQQSPGEYTLIPLYLENGSWKVLDTEGIKVQVKEAPSGTDNLNCVLTDFLPDNPQVTVSGVLEGSMTFSNDGAPYGEGILFAFFHDVQASSYSIATHFMPLFIDSGETITKSVSFPHNLPVGNYNVLLYKFDSNGSAERITPREKTQFSFSVVDDSLFSGLSTRIEDQRGFTVLTGADRIKLQSKLPLSRILMFNSRGSCISNLLIPEIKEWEVSTHGLQSGIYLIRALQTNGTWTHTKVRIQ